MCNTCPDQSRTSIPKTISFSSWHNVHFSYCTRTLPSTRWLNRENNAI
jgi:hypothetical protein